MKQKDSDQAKTHSIWLSCIWQSANSTYPGGKCLSLFVGAMVGCLLTSFMLTIRLCEENNFHSLEISRKIEGYNFFIEGKVFLRNNRAETTEAACVKEKKKLEELKRTSAMTPDQLWKKDFQVPAKLTQPRLISDEYNIRRKLLVGIICRGSQPTNKAKMIYYTWGLDALKRNVSFLFFVTGEDDFSDFTFFPHHRLSDGAAVSKTAALFEALDVVYSKYSGDFDWFFMAHDDVYLRTDLLLLSLKPIDPKGLVYMGHSGRGREADQVWLRLLPHETYCMGGPGFVLSFATLKLLHPFLGFCLDAVERNNMLNSDTPWTAEDIELGRCISRTVGIQCSASHQANKAFLTDWDKTMEDPSRLWKSPRFKNAIVVYPVHTFAVMRGLHHYYMHHKVQMIQSVIKEHYHGPMVDTCQLTPQKLLPKGMTSSPSYCNEQAQSCYPLQYHYYTRPYPDMDPYKPDSRHDLSEWMFFDENKIYLNDNDHPVVGKTGEFNEKLRNLIHDIKGVLNAKDKNPITGLKILSGFFREDSHRGREILVDIEMTNYTVSKGGSMTKAKIQQRVELIQPVSRQLNIELENVFITQTLNVILPLVKGNQVRERFSFFMKQYSESILAKNGDARLIVVVYGTEALSAANDLIQPYLEKYSMAKAVIVPADDQYSYTSAVNSALKEVPPKELIYIADVDTSIRSDFVMRCRKTSIQGKRVYVPVPFQLYNDSYTYKMKVRPAVTFISRDAGFWDEDNLDHMCIYKTDLVVAQTAAKYVDSRPPQGSSGYILAGAMKQGLQILRAPDPGLMRLHQPKICSSWMDPPTAKACKKWSNQNLADRRDLAVYLQKLEDHFESNSWSIRHIDRRKK